MNQSRDILKSVRDTIKQYVDGTVNYDRAFDEYKLLLNRYKLILNTVESQNGRFLKGLFYHHNSENFSKLTALAKEESGNIDIIEFYGDQNLMDISGKFLQEFIPGTKQTELQKNLLVTNEELDYYMYFKKISVGQDHFYCFTITSSLYFREYPFSFLTQVVSKLLNNFNNHNRLTCINFIDHFSDTFQRLLADSQSKMIYADIFIFDSIEIIFNHTGIHDLIDISDSISDTLSQHFISYLKIFIFSSITYVVLSEKKEGAQGTRKVRKPYFVYNEITLPYKHMELKISSEQSVYKFLDELYIFENYIKNGDK